MRVPGSLKEGDEEGMDEMEEEEEEPQPEFDREQLIERYHVSSTCMLHPTELP